MQPLPVTLVTGFLGAGKSTWLSRWLKEEHGLRIGLLINEAGPAAIDLPSGAQAMQVDLPEGCACCVRSPELQKALQELAGRGDLDRIVLETTGLADPMAIGWAIDRPELRALVRLDAIVTVVDAVNHALAPREEWTSQVAAADLVAIAKAELVESLDEVTAAIRVENRDVRIARADELPAALIFDLPPPVEQRPLRSHARHSDFGGCALVTRAALDPGALEDWIEALPPEVFRAKGIARVGPDAWWSFHVVGGRLQLTQGAPAPAHGESRLVFFGRGLDHAALRARLAGCEREG